jgi:hypothetical protein
MVANGNKGAAGQAGGIDRRGFLKVGAGFTLAATLAGTLYGCGDSAKAPAPGHAFLQPADVELFSAVAPAVVLELDRFDPAQRKKLLGDLLHNIDSTCAALDLGSRQELRKLLDLLAIKPLRYVLTGVGDWGKASVADTQAFLERWRSSRLATLNAGGNVLVKLTASSFFVLPASFASAGYPGPLEYAFKALNT